MSQQRISIIRSLLPFDDKEDEDDNQASISGTSASWWRRRGWIIGLSLFLFMILLGGFLLFLLNHRPPTSYQTKRVTQGNLVLTVSATGSAQADTYNINFPGMSTPGASATFSQSVDPSVLQVVASVNESDIANVKVGDPAQFTVSAYGNRIFTGVVSAISSMGVTVSNIVTFPVYVNVDTNDLQGATLLPGMTANVTIEVARRTHVLLIPVKAVNFARTSTVANTATGSPALISQEQVTAALDQASRKLQQLQHQHPAIAAENPTPAFVLQRSDGHFIAKPVVLGLTDGTNYEVLAGLSLGETIIVGVAGPPLQTKNFCSENTALVYEKGLSRRLYKWQLIMESYGTCQKRAFQKFEYQPQVLTPLLKSCIVLDLCVQVSLPLHHIAVSYFVVRH